LNLFDYAKPVADFWTAQGEAFLKAQQQAGRALADGVQAAASGTLPELTDMPTDPFAGVADLASAGQSVMEMWSAATAMCGKLATTLPASAASDTTVEATFRKMIDPRSWMANSGEIDDVLGRMAEGPRFADLWEVERHYARVLQAWMTVRRRGLEHSAVVLEAWLQAGRRFAGEFAGRAGTDAPAQDAKAVLALWTETANRQLLETQRSEPFLQTQAAMIRASTELRMHSRSWSSISAGSSASRRARNLTTCIAR
jgi:polyhydroxyalkanoate synthase subunit PhaE